MLCIFIMSKIYESLLEGDEMTSFKLDAEEVQFVRHFFFLLYFSTCHSLFAGLSCLLWLHCVVDTESVVCMKKKFDDVNGKFVVDSIAACSIYQNYFHIDWCFFLSSAIARPFLLSTVSPSFMATFRIIQAASNMTMTILRNKRNKEHRHEIVLHSHEWKILIIINCLFRPRSRSCNADVSCWLLLCYEESFCHLSEIIFFCFSPLWSQAQEGRKNETKETRITVNHERDTLTNRQVSRLAL